MFWWGDFYGFCQKAKLGRTGLAVVLVAIAFAGYALGGPRNFQRAAMQQRAVLLAPLARNSAAAARLTEPMGDMSFGSNFFAYPLQQLGAHYGTRGGRGFYAYPLASLVATAFLACLAWQ